MKFTFLEYLLKNTSDTVSIKINNTYCKFIDLFDNIKDNNIFIKELDKVFLFANKLGYDYINENIWFQYLFVKQIEIPAISKKLTTQIKSHTDKGKSINIDYVENKRSKELYFNDSSEFLFDNEKVDLFHSISKKGTSNYYICIIKKATFNNIKELLYIFLDCLFSTQKPYCIKKCKYCEKYYVAIKTDTNYCDRIFKIKNSYVPCSRIVSTIQKSNEYKKYKKEEKIFLQELEKAKFCNENDIKDYKDYAKEHKQICYKTRDLSLLNNIIMDYKKDIN